MSRDRSHLTSTLSSISGLEGSKSRSIHNNVLDSVDLVGSELRFQLRGYHLPSDIFGHQTQGLPQLMSKVANSTSFDHGHDRNSSIELLPRYGQLPKDIALAPNARVLKGYEEQLQLKTYGYHLSVFPSFFSLQKRDQ